MQDSLLEMKLKFIICERKAKMKHSWMKVTESFFDDLFQMFGNIILSFIRQIAPMAVPAAPALSFGYTVYYGILAMTANPMLAGIIGGVAALGLESAGLLGAHIAVELYTSGQKKKANIAILISVCYLIFGIVGIVLSQTITPDTKTTGITMFLITGMVYVLRALSEDAKVSQERKHSEAAIRVQRENEDRRLQQEVVLANLNNVALLDRQRAAEKDKRLLVVAKAKASTAQPIVPVTKVLPQVAQANGQVTPQLPQGIALDFHELDTTGKVLAYYAVKPKAKQKEVSLAVGVTRQRIGQTLQKLEKGGVISRNGGGVIAN